MLDHANAIRTTYLRAGYLPAPYGDESRDLLREYVPLQVGTSDPVALAANVARSEAIHAQLWSMAEQVAHDQPSDVISIYVESLNEVINLHTSRTDRDRLRPSA